MPFISLYHFLQVIVSLTSSWVFFPVNLSVDCCFWQIKLVNYHLSWCCFLEHHVPYVFMNYASNHLSRPVFLFGCPISTLWKVSPNHDVFYICGTTHWFRSCPFYCCLFQFLDHLLRLRNV